MLDGLPRMSSSSSSACRSARSAAPEIAEAYRVQPPDDEILILDERADGDVLVGG